MSVETRIIPNWSALEGAMLPGGYEVERCLSADHLAALFRLRILGDRFTEAVIRVFSPASVSAEEVQTWQDAVALRHPNLGAPISAGFTVLDTAQLPYLAFARPDETLDGVLGERALSPDEAREVLSNTLNCLAYLHSIGWVHSALAPAEILAVGNAIQLSGVHARRIGAGYATILPAVRYFAPESKTANATPAADLFCLGASLFEVLTRRRFEESDRPQFTVLPYPFDGIAEACLRMDAGARPGIEEIRGMLVRPAPVRPPAPAPLPSPAVATPIAPKPALSPQPKPLEPPKPAPPASVAEAAPVLVSYPSRSRRQELDDTQETHVAGLVWLGMPLRNWLYLSAAVVALLAVLWVFHPKPSPSAAVVQPSANGTPANWPPRVAEPAPSSAASQTEAPKTNVLPANKPVSASSSDASWRVVAYTFNREADAEKQLSAIKAKHPGLDPHIFSPKGNGSPYLLVLGGRMTKDEAGRLRSKARASGLPRDTYVQNYSR